MTIVNSPLLCDSTTNYSNVITLIHMILLTYLC